MTMKTKRPTPKAPRNVIAYQMIVTRRAGRMADRRRERGGSKLSLVRRDSLD